MDPGPKEKTVQDTDAMLGVIRKEITTTGSTFRKLISGTAGQIEPGNCEYMLLLDCGEVGCGYEGWAPVLSVVAYGHIPRGEEPALDQRRKEHPGPKYVDLVVEVGHAPDSGAPFSYSRRQCWVPVDSEEVWSLSPFGGEVEYRQARHRFNATR